MKRYKTGTLFPNSNETAAYYSSTAFCITLNTITSSQFKQIKHKEPGFTDQKKILYHEMRHHIDHLSTLWGQRRIIGLYEAVNAKFSLTEVEFPKMAAYKNEEKQFHYYDYFTEVHGAAEYETPFDRWEWRISSGARFNPLGEVQLDKPILLLRLRDPLGRMSLRAPITIGSLLEANAVYEETIVEKSMLLLIEEKNREKAKEGNIKRLIKALIYNSEMAEYNCAVHLLANMFGVEDPYIAFEIASSIATLAMNLPFSVTDRIPIDKEYMEVWGQRTNDFIKDHNYGFLFFNMVNNYKTAYKQSSVFDGAEFMAINQLPKQAELERIILEEMEHNIQSIKPGSYFSDFFKEHLEAGMELFKMRGADGKRLSLSETISSGKYTPFIVNSDTAFSGNYTFLEVLNDNEIMKNIEMTDWYHLAHELNGKMEEFYQVCGV